MPDDEPTLPCTKQGHFVWPREGSNATPPREQLHAGVNG